MATSLERNLNLSVPAVEIESEIQARLKRLARTVKMQGFRPGKVPISLVTKQYGFQVRQEVVTDSVNKSFSDAVRAQNVRVAGMPRFAPANSGQNADSFEFTATFEVYPEVKVASLAGRKLVKEFAEVADSDVDNTLETLRKQRATFEKVERQAQMGDFLVIDFSGTLDGVPFDGGKAENFGVVIGEKRLLPDFEAALVGLKPGESKTFDLTFPADYKEDLAGKTVQFAVTVKLVNEAKLPAIDAEFAKSLGVADGNVQQMRSEIKQNLEREAKKRTQAKVKEQVMDALIETTAVELPRSLVGMEIARLQEGAKQDLESRGMTTKDMSLPVELFVDRAEKRVKLGLILSELVRQQNLLAKPEQVRAMIEELADSYEEPAQMIKWYYTQPERLAEVEAVVAEENVVNWCASQMNVAEQKTSFDALMGIERA
ncbi:MAG: trigger factor [Burkholderiales bacterium]|nr:trigger factor [Burkholderiales bacterium]